MANTSTSVPFARRGRGARPFPKGRQVDDQALAEMRAVVAADDPEARLRPDLLIENLHRLQDRYGALFHRHLAALAEASDLSLTEVYEVATFYAHFDVLADGESPAPLTVRVCDSVTCAMMGGETLADRLTDTLGPDVRVMRAPCMGRCATAPVAEVGHRHLDHASEAKIVDAVAHGQLSPEIPAYRDFAAYSAAGGYGLLRACREGRRSPEEIIAVIDEAGLRGFGGAGFPTALKWRAVAKTSKPRLMAVNADEGEPGTFKDRFFLESDPHRFLEGMLIAAWAVDLDEIYVYVRDEYPAGLTILTRELAALEDAGLTGGASVYLRRGAGAYICGEESAMMASIEGKRGLPRHRPPYVSEVGLFGRPTLSHNVETLFWVRDVVEKGADWFASQGVNGAKGPRSFSVSGRVAEPGVKLAPAGITVRALIDEHCGGMAPGHRFAGYLPGGASGGILPASMDDIPLDFGTLEAHGCLIGSAAVIVFSDQDDVREIARNLMRFFADESCGQCTPCRLGTEKALMLMQHDDWDEPLLTELSDAMRDASICGLGQAAPNPLMCVFKYF
ncbi:MAG: NAD(P)H-dependent oxidoreductase subunit E [Pseudomonadota bacterium]